MTGAHYEILRRLSLSNTLPQVSDLRNLLRQVWGSASAASIEDEVKRFPIRIINAGVRDTLRRASEIGLAILHEIETIAYELETVRDVVTARTRLHGRPYQESTGANKHFFALEYLESQFMVAFLSEIKKRIRCVSIIWLHDGLWVPKELSNSLLLVVSRLLHVKLSPPCPHGIACFESKISLYHGSSLMGRDIWAILEISFHLPLTWTSVFLVLASQTASCKKAHRRRACWHVL